MPNYITSIHEPIIYIQATHHPYWKEAMDKEFTSPSLNNTWNIVVLPTCKKALPSKWAYKVKQHSDGCIERLKARLVIRADV